MLINALCEYYDILAKAGKVLPDGYSSVKIHFLVSLTDDGRIDSIIDYRMVEELPMGNGKVKTRQIPRDIVMPQRTEKPGIDANIAEHRPLYLFGLNLEKDKLTAEDNTGKAQKSHEALKSKNLEFLEGLDSPLINAYRKFLQNWCPADETGNEHLLRLGKDYGKSGFAFCLSGYPEKMLQDDSQIREKWEQQYQGCEQQNDKSAQSAVSGEHAVIARIHNKIKGVYGGLATGTVLIGYNNPSESSYCKEQSYNSNISESEMKKYTEALNYLLGNPKHKILLDDITVIFWAANADENCEDAVMAMLLGNSDSAGQTEDMLRELLNDACQGKITSARLESSYGIDSNTDFYILGLKPNSSRLAVKFIYRKRYADILWNIARFQEDMQISRELHPVSLDRIRKEIKSPKSKTETINPELFSKLFESILYGRKYPMALLENVIRRIKTDTDRLDRINEIRAGIIKACINRNYEKEEIKMALDKENYGQAYLCGRLFAVLEKLQQDASGNSLNRTIKDAYFASASSKPAMVFPKLIKLAQNHLNKVKSPVFYNKLIGEIINQLNGEFPDTLMLVDQGKFIIGYYQQYQSFFEKNEASNKNVTEEDEDGN